MDPSGIGIACNPVQRSVVHSFGGIFKLILPSVWHRMKEKAAHFSIQEFGYFESEGAPGSLARRILW
jgi:hypothetical protein